MFFFIYYIQPENSTIMKYYTNYIAKSKYIIFCYILLYYILYYIYIFIKKNRIYNILNTYIDYVLNIAYDILYTIHYIQLYVI